MAISAAQLMVNIGANPAGAIAGIEQVSGMMGAGGILPMAALGAGAIMAGVGIAAAKMAGDFQSGLTSLVTGAGETQKNLGLVHDGILALARDTGTSVKQLVDGMYMIESGGFHGANGLAILKAAAEGAKVGSADLGVVADTVDTILKNYGEGGALSATQATNALITTVANGKTHLEDLASSLSFVLPAGSAAGLGLKDVMGAMAELTNVGIPAAEAATYLRQMIIALEAPSAGARKALLDIGITTDQLAAHMKKGLPDALQFIETQLENHGIKPGTAQYVAALREISGGTRQMQGMLNLMGPHLGDFAKKVDLVGGAASKTGTEVTGWALVQQNANQQFDRAKESIVTVFIAFGEKLLPIVTTVAKFFAGHLPGALKTFQTSVGPIVQKIGDFFGMITSNKPLMNMLADSFKRLAPIIGPVLTVLAVLTAISFAPLALLIGIVLGLIVVFTHIPDAIHNASAALGNLLGTIGTFFGHVFGAIGEFVGHWVGKWLELQQRTIETVKQFIGDSLGRIDAFKDSAIQHAKDLATNFINALLGLPGKMITLGENLLKSLAKGLDNARGAVVSSLKNVPLIGGLAGSLNAAIPQFASGGTMAHSGLALVGENGPEMVYLPAGARVSPNFGGAGSGGSGGAGGAIHVHVNIDGRRAAEAIVPHMTPYLRNALGSHRY